MWRRQAGGQWVQQPVQTRRSHSGNVLLCPHLQVACAPSCVADIHTAAVLYGGLYRRQRSRAGSGNWREHLLPVITGEASLFRREARFWGRGVFVRRMSYTMFWAERSAHLRTPSPPPAAYKYVQLLVQKPGGSLLSSGSSRPLSSAYRVLVGSLRWRL